MYTDMNPFDTPQHTLAKRVVFSLGRPVGFGSLVALALYALLALSQAHAAGELHIYNKANYIGMDSISNFSSKYKVKITYSEYTGAEDARDALLENDSKFDLILGRSSSIAPLLPLNIVQKIDRKKLTNWSNLSKNILAITAKKWDPKNRYIVPYSWGVNGVVYNSPLVKATNLSEPIRDIRMLFDPKYTRQLDKCGVAFMDSAFDIVPMLFAYLKQDIYAGNQRDFDRAYQALMALQPYIDIADSNTPKAFLEEQYCVLIGSSYGQVAAEVQNLTSPTSADISFLAAPKTVADLWVDGWVIPSKAKNVDNAYLFLDFLLTLKFATYNINNTWHAGANEAAKKRVNWQITSNKNIYWPIDDVKRFPIPELMSPRATRMTISLWDKFKRAAERLPQ